MCSLRLTRLTSDTRLQGACAPKALHGGTRRRVTGDAEGARSGTPVRAVMNLDKASMERPLSRHLAMRCEVCGAKGVKTFDTDSGRRCALDVGV